MKTLLFLLLAACTLLPARAQSLTAEWAVSCSGGRPTSQAIDAQGNLYVSGIFSGTITLGTTTLTAVQPASGVSYALDSFLAKLNAQGQYQWAVQFGDGQFGGITQIVTDNADNIYMTGSFRSYSLRLGAAGPVLYNSNNDSEGFVARFSGQTGQCQWARRFGSIGADTGSVLALNAAGEVFLAGTVSNAEADFGPFTLPAAAGYRRCFLAKLNPAGTWLWAQQLGNNGTYIGSLTPDGQGSLYVAGAFSSPSVTLGATTLTTNVVSGGSSGTDALIAKYSEAGGLRWARQANPGGFNKMGIGCVAYDGQGHLYVTGNFSSQTARLGSFTLPNAGPLVPDPTPAPPTPNVDQYYRDAYVARFDTAGTWQWATRWGGPYDDYAGNHVLDGAGRLVVSLNGNANSTLAVLNPATGSWATTYALPVPVSLTTDQLGRLYLGGIFTTPTLSLGGQSVANAGNNSITGFAAKLGPLVLATQAGSSAHLGLQAWPTPGPGTCVWVQGTVAGQAVEVLDVLGRRVGGGTMPASGPLRLTWTGAGLAPGMYVVRSGGQSCRWVVE